MIKTIQSISRKPQFWIIQVFGFLICTYLAIHLYPKAFPIVDLEIKMDRLSALKKAQGLADLHRWGPVGFRQSASFDLDQQTQTYVELAAGGSSGFAKLLQDGLYSPFTWKVRHFAEGKTEESLIRFTPKGDFYGFGIKVPENQPGPALPVAEALKIAEESAVKDWGLSLREYNLVEKSLETQPSKRVDHTFVYERKKEIIGEGHYRLKLVVSGDRLTELKHFVKIPNAFSRKYSEMRSANNTISSLSNVAMAILYLFGGCGLGIFFLARQRWLIWKTPLLFGVIVATFQLLEQFNQFPLIWMGYDTALSSSGFVFRNLAYFGIQFLVECLLLSVSFMAAESLSRKAFPYHPQLWKIWTTDPASSFAILGRTVGGYLSVGFFFLFVVVMYLVGTKYLGWWSPSDTLFQPDGLATYFPWFTSVSNSLHAGFWEECLFRAVPLASAALLGARFGNKKAWLTAGFIIQALIFASAHANYPAQPSYARVIELIIPSFIFGGIYLAFGLLPGIILHYTFDVVSFSIPLFATSAPRIWADRILVVLVSFIPLWIVLYSRWKRKAWKELSPKDLNGAWIPHRESSIEEKEHVHHVQPTSRFAIYGLGGLGIIGIILWFFVLPFRNDAPTLELNREQAISLARGALSRNGVDLNPAWQPLAVAAEGIGEDDRFIWKTEGKTVYHQLIGNYLSPPTWLVRFVRFDVDVAERAEEYQVYLTKKGEVFRLKHELPEARKGASLDQDQARKLALVTVQKTYGLDPLQFKEVSSTASQLPNRRDWIFVYSDPRVPLKIGEARFAVRISGDESSSSRKFIFIPEEWQRQERNKQNTMALIKTICTVLIIGTFLGGIIYSLVSWTKKNFDVHAFKIAMIFIFCLGIINFLNQMPTALAQFSTVEPRLNQFVTMIAMTLVRTFFFALCASLIIGLVHRFTQNVGSKLEKPLALINGYSLGIVSTLTLAAVMRLLPSESPTWGKLGGIDDFIPPLLGLQSLEKYILMCLSLFIVGIAVLKLTRGWNHRPWLGVLFLFIVGFAISGTEVEEISHWAVLGSAVGLCMTVAFRFFIQSHLSLIPLATASAVALLEWKQIALKPYPGISLNGTLAILLIIASARFWHGRLSRVKG